MWIAAAAMACGDRPPTAPTADPATGSSLSHALAGQWSGFASWTSCDDTHFAGCYVGPLDRFEFTFERSAAGWTGSVHVDGFDSGTEPVPVRGVEDADGRGVTFSGATTPASPTSAVTTVSSLHVRPDSGRGLMGTVAMSHRQSGTSGRTVTVDGEIASAARGLDPAFPRPEVTLDGAWFATTFVETCTTSRGEPCPRYPRSDDLSLFVTGGLDSPRALVNLPTNVVVELAGVANADGSIAFHGAADHPGHSISRTEVPVFVVRAAPDGLTGRFEYLRHHEASRNQPAGVARYAGQIVAATREGRAFTPGPFQGSWRGEAVAMACLAGDCDGNSDVYDMRLDLSQAGDEVVGDVEFRGFGVPLSGTAAGGTVALAGARTVDPCRELSLYVELCAQEVRHATLTLDEFGRLHGELDLTLRFKNGTQVVRVRLVAVVREL